MLRLAAGDGIALSYHWLGPEGQTVVWDGVRTWIPTTVEPGGVVWLDARIESPDRIGRLWLRWDMVREGVAWFSQRDSTPQRARMVIVAESPLAGTAGWALISLSLALLTIAVVEAAL